MDIVRKCLRNENAEAHTLNTHLAIHRNVILHIFVVCPLGPETEKGGWFEA